MNRIPMPDRFDGLKYFNKFGDYASQSQPGTLDVPDGITEADVADCVTRLDDLKAQKIEELWNAASKYESRYISGSAPAAIAKLVIAGNEKAIATEAWVNGIWADDYNRRQTVSIAETEETIHAVSDDFNNNGPIPYSIFETLFGA